MVQLGASNTIITPKDLLIVTCALLHFVFFFARGISLVGNQKLVVHWCFQECFLGFG